MTRRVTGCCWARRPRRPHLPPPPSHSAALSAPAQATTGSSAACRPPPGPSSQSSSLYPGPPLAPARAPGRQRFRHTCSIVAPRWVQNSEDKNERTKMRGQEFRGQSSERRRVLESLYMENEQGQSGFCAPSAVVLRLLPQRLRLRRPRLVRRVRIPLRIILRTTPQTRA